MDVEIFKNEFFGRKEELNLVFDNSEQEEYVTSLLNKETFIEFEKNALTKYIAHLSRNNTGSVTNTEEVEVKREVKNIPPAAVPAPKVAAASKIIINADPALIEKLKKLGFKDDGIGKITGTIDHKILNLYADNFDYFRKKYMEKNNEKIENEAGFFITVVTNNKKDPEKYPVPACFYDAEKQEAKSAKKKELSSLGEMLGIKGLPDIRTIKSYISSFKNCFKTNEEIQEKTFENAFMRELELSGNPEHADLVAAREVKVAIEKSSQLRRNFENVLSYLGINDDLNKFNYISLINKSINKVEVKFANC